VLSRQISRRGWLVQIRSSLSDAPRWAGGWSGIGLCMILLLSVPSQLLPCSTFSQLECLSRLTRGLLQQRVENSKLDACPRIQPDVHSQQQDAVMPAWSCASESYIVGCGLLWATWDSVVLRVSEFQSNEISVQRHFGSFLSE
jgi:hypothetical protein